MAYKSKADAAAAQRRWRRKNPDKVRAIQAKYRAKHGDRRLERRLKYRYGISRQERTAMLEAQFGCCAICRIPESQSSGRRLVVDHNHDTGRVRALLCNSCNVAVAHVKESAEIARAIATYLEQHKRAVA